MPLRRHGARFDLTSIDDPAFSASIPRQPLLLVVAVTKVVGANLLAPQPGMELRTDRRH